MLMTAVIFAVKIGLKHTKSEYAKFTNWFKKKNKIIKKEKRTTLLIV